MKAMLRDLKRIWPAFIAVPAYILITDLVFGAMCPLKIMTGVPCPACGISRAFLLFFTKGPVAAASFNFCMYLWGILIIVALYERYIGRKKRLTIVLAAVVVAITVGYWIYRMITVFPGAEPMIYHEKNMLRILSDINKKQ